MGFSFFLEERRCGEKHDKAIEKAVARVKERFPRATLAATDLRHTISRLRPRGSREVFHIIEKPDGTGAYIAAGPPLRVRVNRRDRSRDPKGHKLVILGEISWPRGIS